MKTSLKAGVLALMAAGLITSANASTPASGTDDTSTTSVPLQVIPVSGNDYKVGITVSVAGGPPTMLTFDTGGAGLHIFASQVGNTNLTYTNQHIKSAFISGLVYEGTIAYAPVTFGNVTTKPVPVLVIQKAYCMPGKPNCGAGSDPTQFTPVMGHFYGELGASMEPEVHNNNPKRTLYTPFRALPGNYGSGFIIENLSPGGDARLILGLTPENTAGFNKVHLPVYQTAYPDGATAYNAKSLMVTYTVGMVTHQFRTAFDTGGDAVIHFFTGNSMGFKVNKRKALKPGQDFSASIPGVFNWQFTTGTDHGVNFATIGPIQKGKGGPFVNTGISFFFAYDVMYDFKDGMLGFKPH